MPPTLAQLVELLTVVVYLISKGRWFKSGRSENKFIYNLKNKFI